MRAGQLFWVAFLLNTHLACAFTIELSQYPQENGTYRETVKLECPEDAKSPCQVQSSKKVSGTIDKKFITEEVKTILESEKNLKNAPTPVDPPENTKFIRYHARGENFERGLGTSLFYHKEFKKYYDPYNNAFHALKNSIDLNSAWKRP